MQNSIKPVRRIRWRNDSKTYGTISRLFHWIMAALVIAAIILGICLDYVPGSWRSFAYTIHKSLGILIFVFVLVRFGWRSYSPAPELPPLFNAQEKRAAHAGHMLIYVLLLLMPLIGWGMSSAGAHKVTFFYLFALPPLTKPDPALASLLGDLHSIFGYALAGMIVLHILAVFWHRRTKKVNLLYRMWPVIK